MLRPAILIWIIIIGLSGATVFYVKNRVKGLRDDLFEIERQISLEKQSLHVLKAEWAYLNQPERLKTLADRYLPLEQISATQFSSSETMTRRLALVENIRPTREVVPTLRPILSSASGNSWGNRRR